MGNRDQNPALPKSQVKTPIAAGVRDQTGDPITNELEGPGDARKEHFEIRGRNRTVCIGTTSKNPAVTKL